MARFILNAVVKQQLAVAYLMVQKYDPDISIEDFGKLYADTLKNKKAEIQIVIKKLSVKG
ncbi:MAG: hypothetical protein K2M08_07875 [Anaeroplasmataceae bacterium]|nr:hypothetical protein [Anaeroplasmataceae bacterium]